MTRVQELEKAGLDLVWVPEAYSFDAISQVGFLAAKTERVEIGTGIINVFSRTATAIAQTAAGCDFVSDGRFVLGLGASGPQVIEGFHGVPYEHPMPRIREYIDVCRMVWRREPVVYDGQVVQVPLPDGQGTGLGKPLKLINHPKRADIPVFWASLMGRSVAETARHADGWLPVFFDPEQVPPTCGATTSRRGLAERDPALGPLQISAGGMVAIGEEYAGDGADRVLDLARPQRRRSTSAGWAPATRTSTTRSPSGTGTSTRPPRSRTSTCPGARRRRRPPCPGSCSPTPTSSAPSPRRRAHRRLPGGRRHPPVGHAVGPDPVKTVETLRGLLD